MAYGRAKRRKRRPIFLTMLLALAVLLGALYRGCLGPLGIDTGMDSERADTPPSAPAGDAQVASDAGPAIPDRCALRLGSMGLTLNGEPVEVDDAVRICRQVGSANLEVSGMARTGTYQQIKRALGEAGVPLDERQWPERQP